MSRSIICGLVVLCSAGLARASTLTASFLAVPSYGAAGDSGNTTLTYMYTGPDFAVGDIHISGTVTEDSAAAGTVNWVSDAVVGVTSPGGSFIEARTSLLNSGGTGSTSDTYTTVTSGFGGGENAVGLWTFEFYERLGYDEVASWPDNWHEWIDITLEKGGPPEATDLGIWGPGPEIKVRTDIGASTELDWYTLTLTAEDTLTFSTSKTSTIGAGAITDTELGLYDGAGNLIANDDDGGTGLYSEITAALGPDTYYIVVGGYNTTFGAGGWNAASTSGLTGDYWLNITPEPGTICMILLGGLMFVLRRRRA